MTMRDHTRHHILSTVRGIPLPFILGTVRPYRLLIGLFVFVSVMASLFDGVSVGLLVPLLGSLQGGGDFSALPSILAKLASLFQQYRVEQQIVLSVGAVVAAVLLKNGMASISFYLNTWLSSRITADLRVRASEMLLNVDLDFYHHTRAGDLVERALTHTFRLEYLVIQLCDFFGNAATFSVLFVLLLLFSWPLTATTILGVGVIALCLNAYTRFLARAGQRSDSLSRELASALQETINGIRLIKASAQENSRFAWLKQRIEDYRRTNRHIAFGNYMVHTLTESLGVVGIALVFFVAIALHTGDQRLLLVQFLPFLYMLTRLLPILKELNRTRAEIASLAPFAYQVYELLRLDDKPIMKGGHAKFPGLERAIRFHDVTFNYPGDQRPAVADVDLVIPRGKITAIVGASGSGKTTLVNLLLRYYDPRYGRVYIDEMPLKELELGSYRTRIGLVSQDTFIFHDTVRNNIAFGSGEIPDSDRVLAAAKLAGAHDFIQALPQGYDTILGDLGSTLSGGQRQRLSIARAILKDPDILILDEATSSLDARTEVQIHDAIVELCQGRTVIVIAHRRTTIQQADQIVVFKEGRVVEIGVEDRLLQNKGEYYRLAHVR